MLAQSSPAPRAKKKLPALLIAGFITLATTALIGGGGIVAAHGMDRPSRDDCRRAGYRNYGQCVSDWRHQHNPGHANGHGHGYGGGNTSVIGDISLVLQNSNNNVINIIINIFR